MALGARISQVLLWMGGGQEGEWRTRSLDLEHLWAWLCSSKSCPSSSPFSSPHLSLPSSELFSLPLHTCSLFSCSAIWAFCFAGFISLKPQIPLTKANHDNMPASFVVFIFLYLFIYLFSFLPMIRFELTLSGCRSGSKTLSTTWTSPWATSLCENE